MKNLEAIFLAASKIFNTEMMNKGVLFENKTKQNNNTKHLAEEFYF